MVLSIIIPVYNEEKTVAKLLDKVLNQKLPSKIKKTEVLIIDDGSTDGTRIILQSIQLRKASPCEAKIFIFHHKINRGKGAAIRTALKHANGDIFIIQDADLEYEPSDYPRLLQPILENGVHVVYGSRFKNRSLFIPGKNNSVLLVNRAANKLLTFFTNALFKSNLTDMETCYKIFTKKALRKIHLKSNRFAIEPEITAKFLKNGHKIIEVPITSHPRSLAQGKKITWKDGIVALWALVKYRFGD